MIACLQVLCYDRKYTIDYTIKKKFRQLEKVVGVI